MFSIRLAKTTDAESIAKIYSEYVLNTAFTFDVVPPDIKELEDRIEKVSKDYPFLVCECGGKIVGYAYASQHRARESYQWSVDVSVYIDVPWHRKGIGKMLYVHLFEILRKQGYFNAYAGITLPNLPSVALHESLGFSLVGVYKNVGYKFSSWQDVGWWQCTLQKHSDNPQKPKAFEESLLIACSQPFE